LLTENGVVNEGKEGKSQGIEGRANANDVWVWMRHTSDFALQEIVISFLSFDSLS
jgi:hypothetical protein